ncbi:MAG: glycosyltransferase family 39 protein [Thermodesulfobacteriota bacterium]
MKIFGIIANPSDFLELYLTNPSSFLLIGRSFLGLVMGTVSLPVIYWLGKKLFSRNVGLLSAFFRALSTLHVRDSHYACNNILLMLMIMLFYLSIVQLLETYQNRYLIASAVFLGLNIETKYNAGLLLIPALFAFIPLYGKDWSLKIKRIILFLLWV